MPACVPYREHVCVIQRAAIAHHELKAQDIREKSHCMIEMMVFDVVDRIKAGSLGINLARLLAL